MSEITVKASFDREDDRIVRLKFSEPVPVSILEGVADKLELLNGVQFVERYYYENERASVSVGLIKEEDFVINRDELLRLLRMIAFNVVHGVKPKAVRTRLIVRDGYAVVETDRKHTDQALLTYLERRLDVSYAFFEGGGFNITFEFDDQKRLASRAKKAINAFYQAEQAAERLQFKLQIDRYNNRFYWALNRRVPDPAALEAALGAIEGVTSSYASDRNRHLVAVVVANSFFPLGRVAALAYDAIVEAFGEDAED